MGLAELWTRLFEQGSGLLAPAVVVAGLAATISLIVKHLAEAWKHSKEAKKIDADALRAAHQGIVECAEAILESSSTMVEELDKAFYDLAYPPKDVNETVLQEWIGGARRYWHEQSYRAALERLIGKLTTLAGCQNDPAITRLLNEAANLLEKVSEKKRHVRNVEERGLTEDVVQAIRNWLSDVRERQIGLAPLVGAISGSPVARRGRWNSLLGKFYLRA